MNSALRSLRALARVAPEGPLLPQPLSFAAAGVLAYVASHLWNSAEATRSFIDMMGVKLPLITQIVYDAPGLIVALLAFLATVSLVLGYLHPPRVWSEQSRAWLGLAGWIWTAAALGLGTLVHGAFPLVWIEASRTMCC